MNTDDSVAIQMGLAPNWKACGRSRRLMPLRPTRRCASQACTERSSTTERACTDVEGLLHVNLTGVLTRAGTNILDACTLARRAGLLSTVLHLENSLTAWTGPSIIIEANHPMTLAPSVVICREDQMPYGREFCRQLKLINVWATPWSPKNLHLAQEWALEHSS